MSLIYRASLARMLNGFPEPVGPYPEAANQTFKWGDLVYMNGGYLTICGADPASVLGIAKQDGHNTTAGLYKDDVLLITHDTLILMQVHHGTPANAVIEAADLMADYGIAVSGNIWYVDKEETTNKRVRIIEFYDELGTLNGRVAVQFLAANRYLA